MGEDLQIYAAIDWVIIYRTVYVISIKILAVYKARGCKEGRRGGVRST